MIFPTESPKTVAPDFSSLSLTNTITPTIQITQPIPSPSFTPSEISHSTTEQPSAAATSTPSAFISPGWIVFSDLPFRLGVIQTDGKGLRNILENVEFPERAKLSPDGQWIAFIGDPAQLYLVRPDGSELKQLTYPIGGKTSFSWSPDGQAIVYSQTTVTGDQYEVDLFIYEIRTFQIRRLTDTPGVSEHNPVHSPRGDAIGFISSSIQGDDKHLVSKPMIMDIDGSNIRPLTELPMGNVDMFAWSLDGSQIVFSSSQPDQSCNNDLFIVNADSSGLLRLTDTSDQDIYPTWSPDGKWIAFTRAPCNETGNPGFDQIFIIHVNGFGLRQLTDQPNLTITGLSWTPWPALQTDETFTVTKLGANLNLRSSASLSESVLARLAEGEKILVLEGPVEADEYLWWRVRVETSGVEGWVADNPGWFSLEEEE